MSYASLGQAIPQLANLTSSALSSMAITAGGQNFTHCCLRAMNQSLSINASNGSLVFSSPSYFLPSLTIPDLESAVSGSTFPCGASWDGDWAGAPVVRVPYRWCLSQCGGWEMSHFSVLSQWIGPLVQFILPSLAFCLNVPRVRKLAIPQFIFQAHPRSLKGFATYWIRLSWAIVLMTMDTFIWLSVCFAFAGPMLLSGVYEFMLDRKVLEFLSPPKEKSNRDKPVVSKRLKAQLLLAVVVGNLRLSTGRRTRSSTISTFKSIQSDEDHEVLRRQPTSATIDPLSDSTWSRVMAMLDESEDNSRSAGKVSLSTKLKAILNSQASFGSTIGGPILFFVGGFIYTTIDIRTSALGDDDTAHALAFGMWYMTVPHLAIVSSAMLAAASPDALQGIVWDGGAAASRDKFVKGFWDTVKSHMRKHSWLKWFLRKAGGYELMETTYDGQFKTVSLWNRGPNKRRWVQEAIRDYEASFPESIEGFFSPKDVRKGLKENFGDALNAVIATAFLLVVPSALAFLTSYNTPRKGIACRSGTYLIYGVSQVMECLLWTWEVSLKIKYGDRWSEAHTRAKTISWVGQMFVGFFAIFAAVIGTLMQLLGVYRTCACKVPIKYWLYPDAAGAFVDLSSDNPESIEAASDYWVTASGFAVGFICLICALAWWHQRRLRKMFRDEAESLDDDPRPPRPTFDAFGVIQGTDIDLPELPKTEPKIATIMDK